MKITIRKKSAYGVERIYPVDEAAKIFSLLVGAKTLSVEQVEMIRSLGFAIEVERPAPEGWGVVMV